MFSSLPLLRLSTTRTLAPRTTRASTKADPIKEAPPVTNTRVFAQFIVFAFPFDCHSLVESKCTPVPPSSAFRTSGFLRGNSKAENSYFHHECASITSRHMHLGESRLHKGVGSSSFSCFLVP